jgi:hypothetical protein
MNQLKLAYSKTPALRSKPKDQRSIIADVLLSADGPLTFGEIVVEVRKARYEETFRRGTMLVTIEESIEYHLDRMRKFRVISVSNKN